MKYLYKGKMKGYKQFAGENLRGVKLSLKKISGMNSLMKKIRGRKKWVLWKKCSGRVPLMNKCPTPNVFLSIFRVFERNVCSKIFSIMLLDKRQMFSSKFRFILCSWYSVVQGCLIRTTSHKKRKESVRIIVVYLSTPYCF